MRLTHYDKNKKRWQVNIDYGAVMIDALNYAVGEAVDKLADYEDAEEQGLFIRLPCKVGDKVYKLGYGPCHLGNTYPDSFDCDGCEDACDIKQAVVECKAPSVEWIIRNMTGKHPFAYVNREEAETALKGIGKTFDNLPRWKEYGDNQPISRDKVFCCPACGKGRLFKWQLTTSCPHCGLKLSKPEPPKEET